MAGDSFNPEDDDEVEGFGNTSDAGQKKPVSYASTGGSTPQSGSGGFVNLGQMLALNRESGKQSADMLNKEVNDKANLAEKGVKNVESEFNKQALAGSNEFDPNTNLTDAQAKSKVTNYSGPNNIQDTKNVDMNKTREDLQAAMNGVDSLSTPSGVGGFASTKQSLSPRQAAASSFYMGNSNQDFADTKNRFKGLGDLLGAAGTRAKERAATLGSGMADNAGKYGGLVNTINDKTAHDKAESVYDSRNADIARQKAGKVGQFTPQNDQTWAAEHGMTYQEFLDAGSPYGEDDPKYQNWAAKKNKKDRSGM